MKNLTSGGAKFRPPIVLASVIATAMTLAVLAIAPWNPWLAMVPALPAAPLAFLGRLVGFASSAPEIRMVPLDLVTYTAAGWALLVVGVAWLKHRLPPA